MALEKIPVPDFGDVQDITVVEVYIKKGDRVELESPLIALESEKAVMDIPSPYSGVIVEVLVAEEDLVSSGQTIATLEVAKEVGQEGDDGAKEAEKDHAEPVLEPSLAAAKEDGKEAAALAARPAIYHQQPGAASHATPSVRSFAREKGVDLADLAGSGPKGRIVKEDVLAAASRQLATSPSQKTPVSVGAAGDFSGSSAVEEIALGRIQKISGPHLHRSWIGIPHVTHFDEADLTEIEAFRKSLNQEIDKGAPRYSYLSFIIAAVTTALKRFPKFNASLAEDGNSIILKRHYHLGIAVDTPEGLVVPVLRDTDTKGLAALKTELEELSARAKIGKLKIDELQGATFTISSLGGIGGTAFTPIISSPQVAILGISKRYMKPVWNGQQFEAKPTLPFSLSYDHRVIDGADAARFCSQLRQYLEDLKKILV